jgi:hypothetical protein
MDPNRGSGEGDGGRRISAKVPASERRLQAAIASHLRWAREASQEARRAATQPMRDGLRSKWERMADPDGRLTPEELATAVDHLRKAHYRRMALASARARRRATRD